ncbi:MAG: DNA-processing protein DprA [Casimicrobiaceae bacterium]
MDLDARAEAWVRLHSAGLGPSALVALLRAFGSPQAVLAARPAERARHVNAATAKALAAGPPPGRLDATLAWLSEPSHGFLAWDDAGYPAPLLQTADPPALLYTVGDRGRLAGPALAIVGSRNATPQGTADAEAFAEALTRAGLTIVSGLALGIDAAAHRGALAAGGNTIAVIGTGPDRVYPARHRDLAHAIADRGLILSEFAPGTPPLPGNFPRRNRIISGLARGVLVIEATVSSGSLITARMAGEQGRDLFAVPGSIHSPFSRGCHRLIREGAKLVETAQDVLEELRLPAADVSTHAPSVRRETGDEGACSGSNAAAVLAAMGNEVLDVDSIVARAALPAAAVVAALTLLEVDGAVGVVAGGRWQRVVR